MVRSIAVLVYVLTCCVLMLTPALLTRDAALRNGAKAILTEFAEYLGSFRAFARSSFVLPARRAPHHVLKLTYARR